MISEHFDGTAGTLRYRCAGTGQSSAQTGQPEAFHKPLRIHGFCVFNARGQGHNERREVVECLDRQVKQLHIRHVKCVAFGISQGRQDGLFRPSQNGSCIVQLLTDGRDKVTSIGQRWLRSISERVQNFPTTDSIARLSDCVVNGFWTRLFSPRRRPVSTSSGVGVPVTRI